MASPNDLSPAVRDALARLAETSDRTTPAVFAGRSDEFNLLDSAVRGTQRGEVGHTVVIEGVPGSGKTALLNEYAVRLLSASADSETPVVPVPLQPSEIDAPPAAIVQAIDRRFRDFEASGEWKRRVNQALGGASLIGNAVFTTLTRKSFKDFTPSARSPGSFFVALEEYVSFRFDRRKSTIVLLVDEAQNLNDTTRVRNFLGTVHTSTTERTQVLLACFGLGNTASRLRELGLSRLATDHKRSIDVLSDDDAKQVVDGTLKVALADYIFNEEPIDRDQRSRWIGAAASAILDESANFPHHLTNGCRALARIVLDEGISKDPPIRKLRELCRTHRRQYYDARLEPWKDHTTALAEAFGSGRSEWVQVGDVKRALMASDDLGDPVDRRATSAIVRHLSENGYIEVSAGKCRPALPSMTSHFADIRRTLEADNEVVQAIRNAVPDPASPDNGMHGPA